MNFDRIAPFYPAMETLLAGRCLQRSRVAFLEEIPPLRRALIVGEGTGKFLSAFRVAFPEAEIVVVDGSAKMLEIARRRLEAEGLPCAGVEFVHAMIDEWKGPEEAFELVVTNFMLDCLSAEQIRQVVPRIASFATKDARWLIADFQIPEKGPARWRSRWIVALLYRFFRVVCGISAGELHPPDEELRRAGFNLTGRRTWDWGLLKSECWQRR